MSLASGLYSAAKFVGSGVAARKAQSAFAKILHTHIDDRMNAEAYSTEARHRLSNHPTLKRAKAPKKPRVVPMRKRTSVKLEHHIKKLKTEHHIPRPTGHHVDQTSAETYGFYRDHHMYHHNTLLNFSAHHQPGTLHFTQAGVDTLVPYMKPLFFSRRRRKRRRFPYSKKISSRRRRRMGFY